MSPYALLAGLIAVSAVAVIGLLIAWAGKSPHGASTRRLTRIRVRYSATPEDEVAAQLRRATISKAKDGGLAGLIPRREMLEARLRRTGKPWTITQYGIGTMVAIVLFAAAAMVLGAPFVLSVLLALGGGIGVPYFYVGMLGGRRLRKFTATLPDALDLIVRGLRAGLPVTETMTVISNEIPGPTGEEFKEVIEKVRIGQTLDQALNDAAERLGSTEFQFFVISLAIQRETGGNLAETLANLSDVLRKRAQMKLKIRALSSEARASAYIIGALPFIVFGLLKVINGDYVDTFFTDERLIMIGMFSLVWMGIGVAMMVKMIRFEI